MHRKIVAAMTNAVETRDSRSKQYYCKIVHVHMVP